LEEEVGNKFRTGFNRQKANSLYSQCLEKREQRFGHNPSCFRTISALRVRKIGQPERLSNFAGTGREQTTYDPIFLKATTRVLSERMGESGCDVWTHAKIAGWGNIGISTRYVHPSEQAVMKAYSLLGGHSFGHSAKNTDSIVEKKLLVSVDSTEVNWRARRDSNSRPIAPEAIALSN
jgi:hypothetical protein